MILLLNLFPQEQTFSRNKVTEFLHSIYGVKSTNELIQTGGIGYATMDTRSTTETFSTDAGQGA